MFGSSLEETVQSLHACGEDIEISEKFTYLGRVMHNDGGSSNKDGVARHEYLALSVPLQTDEDSDLLVAGDPGLTLWL